MRTITIRRPTIEQPVESATTGDDYLFGTGADDFFGGISRQPLNLGSTVTTLSANSVFGVRPILAFFGLQNTTTFGTFFLGFTQDDAVDFVSIVNAVGLPAKFGGASAETIIAFFNSNGFDEVQEVVPQQNLAAALVDLQAASTAFGGGSLALFGRAFATIVPAVQCIFVNRVFLGWDTSSSLTTQADPGMLTTLVRLEQAFGDLVTQQYGPGKVAAIGIGDTELEALAFVRDHPANFGLVLDEQGGNDRIFGKGGNDVITDFEGNNSVTTEDGDDTIYLGEGNDKIVDKGGNNTIFDLGGNNTITLLETVSFANPQPGIDRVTTGDGNDKINAFDGRNFIDAGNGRNSIRGGENYDEVAVGVGDDFVEVLGATLKEDGNDNGVLETGEDANFNGTLDPADSEIFALVNIGQFYEAHNYVVDRGGSDNIRASGNDAGDDLILSDVTIVVDDPTDFTGDGVPDGRAVGFNEGVFGNDTIEIRDGANLVIDGGGNDTVITLRGDDVIYTSFFAAGNDSISAGAGSDFIIPGSGADTLVGGAGGDTFNLSDTATASVGDGNPDVLVYTGSGDLSLSARDVATFFESAGGLDKIDVRALDSNGAAPGGQVTGLNTRGGLFLFQGDFDTDPADTALNDVLIGWDFNNSGAFALNVEPVIIVLEDTSVPTLANFILA